MVVTTAILASVVAAGVYAAYKRWDYLVDVGTRGVLRFLFALAIIELVVAAIAAGVAWLAREGLGLTASWALTAVTLPVTIGACLLFWSMETRVERLLRLNEQITKPGKREPVYRRLQQLLATMKREDPPPALDLVAAALVLQNGRYYQEALDLLDRVPEQQLDAYERELAAVTRLTCRVYMNDRSGAEAAFADLPSLTPGSDHAHVRDLCRALTLVREGKAAAAHELALAVPEDRCVAARHMVLAHIHSAQRLPAEAKKNLDVLTERRGEDGLHWVVDTQGAASPVAQRLLDGRTGPYR